MGRRNDELLERAHNLPELRSAAREVPVTLKAEGARLYDVDNIGYIDYLGGGGAAIVGFANQFLIDAVRKVLASGVPDGSHVALEVDLAESLSKFLPWVRSWWFTRNHDEAMAAVLPWAREFTGKPLILWLDGGARCGLNPCFVGSGSGADDAVIREVPGWDLERIAASLTGGGSKVAALVVDPLMSGAGVIPAPAGALAGLAETCADCGVLLILDERVSGFRVDRGGAAALHAVTPDVAVYGGALGGGFPIGAVAFREGLEPGVTVGSGSLRAPHVISVAAAEAVLSVLRNDAIYERLEGRGAQLAEGIAALAERFSRPMVVNRLGSVFALYTGCSEVGDTAAARAADAEAYRRFVAALRHEGVLLPDRCGGTAFLSNSHGAKEVDETLEACERVFLKLYQEDLP